jgi:hypothetical protein
VLETAHVGGELVSKGVLLMSLDSLVEVVKETKEKQFGIRNPDSNQVTL